VEGGIERCETHRMKGTELEFEFVMVAAASSVVQFSGRPGMLRRSFNSV